MVVVADTSPLTALLHVGQMHILHRLYGQIFIPSTVVAELNTLPAFGYDISFLKDQDKFIIRQATDTGLMQRLSAYLDTGEAEAIALAKELQADWLLIDEKLGKQFAEAENIPCKGVVGVLIEAKRKGLIPFIKPLLDDLVLNLKFRLSDKIYQLALRRAGE